jgi:tetratricopeptide (TPR) repeat protein
LNTGSFKGKYELLYLLNQLPNEDSDKLITEYLDKFKILLSTNDFENAIVTLEKLFSAISQFQTSLINAEQIYCFKGKVFLMMKRIEEAQASFEYALTINPESSEACEGLGNVFLMTGQYDNAKTMMEWAVKNCPTNLYAVDSLEKINTTVANQMSQNFV